MAIFVHAMTQFATLQVLLERVGHMIANVTLDASVDR